MRFARTWGYLQIAIREYIGGREWPPKSFVGTRALGMLLLGSLATIMALATFRPLWVIFGLTLAFGSLLLWPKRG